MIVNKMHAYGNDFCLVLYEENKNYELLAKSICNRTLGIGGLGLIVIKQKPDLEMYLYDSFGKRCQMDTNALFCFSKYLNDNKLIRKKDFDVIISNAKYNVEITDEGYMINMGVANYYNSMLHINDSIDSFGRVLRINNEISVTIYSLYLGDVHTIILVDDLDAKIIDNVELIVNNPLFKKNTNVHFVKLIDKGNIEIKSFDKNLNLLNSSASGAAASAIALNKLKMTFKKINVKFNLGSVLVELKKDKAFVTGNAKKVFECEFKEED